MIEMVGYEYRALWHPRCTGSTPQLTVIWVGEDTEGERSALSLWIKNNSSFGSSEVLGDLLPNHVALRKATPQAMLRGASSTFATAPQTIDHLPLHIEYATVHVDTQSGVRVMHGKRRRHGIERTFGNLVCGFGFINCRSRQNGYSAPLWPEERLGPS